MAPRRPFEELNRANIINTIYQLPPDIKMYIISMDSSLSKYSDYDDEDDEDNYDYFDDENNDIEDYDEEIYEYDDDILYNPDYVFLNPYRSYGLRYDKMFLMGTRFRDPINNEIADIYIDSIISRMLFLHFLEAMLMEINIYSDSYNSNMLNILITIPDYNKISCMDIISDNINNVLDEYADIYDYHDKLSYMDFIINDENLTDVIGKTLTKEDNGVLSQTLIDFVSYGFGYLFSTTNADEKFDKDCNKYILHWRILRRDEDIENPLKAYGYTEDEYIKYTTKLLEDISNKDTISNSINNYIDIGKQIGIFHEDYTYDKI